MDALIPLPQEPSQEDRLEQDALGRDIPQQDNEETVPDTASPFEWMLIEQKILNSLKSIFEDDKTANQGILNRIDGRLQYISDKQTSGDASGYLLRDALLFQDTIGHSIGEKCYEAYQAYQEETNSDKQKLWNDYHEMYRTSGLAWSEINRFREVAVSHLRQNPVEDLRWKYLETIYEIDDTLHDTLASIKKENALHPHERIQSYIEGLESVRSEFLKTKQNASEFGAYGFKEAVDNLFSLERLSNQIEDLGNAYKKEKETFTKDSDVSVPQNQATLEAYDKIITSNDKIGSLVQQRLNKFDDDLGRAFHISPEEDPEITSAQPEQRQGRLARIGKYLKDNKGLLGVSLGAGFVTRLAFMTAATALTVPGFAAIPAAAIVGNVATKVVGSLYKSYKDGNREKGWWRRAAMQGLKDSLNYKAIGLSLVGSTAGYFLGHLVQGALGSVLHGGQAHVLPGHGGRQLHDVAAAKVHGGSSLPRATIIGPDDVLKNDLQGFIKDNPQFVKTYPALKALAEKALSSGKPLDMLNASKEISFKLIYGSGHNAATRAVGAKLIGDSVAFSDKFKLGSSIVGKMLMRDEAYIKLNGLFGQAKNVAAGYNLAERSGKIGKALLSASYS